MMMKLFHSQLRVNMASGFVTTIVSLVVVAAGYPIYLHFLGYEEYGVWLVLSTVLTFAQLGNLGVNQAVMKLVAEEYGRKDLRAVQEYVMSATLILAISGAAVLALILLFRAQIISLFNLSQDNSRMALWLLPYVGGLSVYVFIVQSQNAAVSGLGRMDVANYILTGGRIVAIVVSGVLLWLGCGIVSLLIGNVLSYVVSHVANEVVIHRIVPVRVLRARNIEWRRVKRLVSFGSGVFGGSIVSMLLGPFNKLMLSRYVGVTAIPAYEIAFNGWMQIRGLGDAGVRAMMPEISRIGAEMSAAARARIIRLNHHVLRLVIVGGVALYGILILLCPWLLKVWLGGQFRYDLPGVFRVIGLGSFLSLIGVPAYYALLGLGRARCVLLAHFIQGAINAAILVGLLLIGARISEMTVAWSVFVSMGGAMLYLLYEMRRTLSSNVWGLPVAGDRSCTQGQ